jgi:hypothetical protein
MSLLEIEQRRSRRAQRKHGKAVKRKKRQSALQIETEQQREERLAKGRAERRQLRQRLAEDDDAVLTFKEWCALNSVSERTGRRILASGHGPPVVQLSAKRIGITVGANRVWQEARERA